MPREKSKLKAVPTTLAPLLLTAAGLGVGLGVGFGAGFGAGYGDGARDGQNEVGVGAGGAAGFSTAASGALSGAAAGSMAGSVAGSAAAKPSPGSLSGSLSGSLAGSGPGAAADPVPADAGPDQGPASPALLLAEQARSLRFVPAPGPIAYCADFSGTGTIPPGDTLLIFDRPAEADGSPAGGAGLDYDGRAASAGPDVWVADERWVGTGAADDVAGYVRMSALLVPTGTADFLDSLPDAYRSAWRDRVLRLGAVADTMLVARGADTRPCPR